MKRFHYVKCLGDNTWLAKPAIRGIFKKDVREAAPLTIIEARELGWTANHSSYALVPVAQVYPAMKLNDAIIASRRFLRTMPESRNQEHDAEWQLGALLEAITAHIEEESAPPFGGVAFDPLGKADDVDQESGYNNGQRADIGKGTIAAYCFLADKPEATAIHINDIDLTEAPEEALTDLLANLMHYCHRESIEFYGHDGPLCSAQRHFAAESGGAAL